MSNKPHLPCPDEDGCMSSDAYSWDAEKKVGYCHACMLKTWEFKGRLYGKREGDSKGSVIQEDFGGGDASSSGGQSGPANNKQLIEDFDDDAEWKYVPMRGITAKTMEFFGTKVYEGCKGYAYDAKSDQEWKGRSDEIRFEYPSVGHKARRLNLPKDHFAHFTARMRKANEFFGQNLFPAGISKVCTICEGEFDVMAAWQMLQDGSRYPRVVVGLPSATPAGVLFEKNRKWLESFEKIILSVDNDEAGKKLAQRMAKMFPNKVFQVDHGEYKDANDMLMAGKGRQFYSSWFKPRKVTPDFVMSSGQDFVKLYDDTPEYDYVPTGITDLDEKILGLHKACYTVIVAPTGIGKTEFMRYLEHTTMLSSPNVKIAVLHLEEVELRSILGHVSYRLQDNLTRKDLIKEKSKEDEVRECLQSIGDSGQYHQIRFSTDSDYLKLVDDLRFLVAAMEIDYVFLEPIQDVVTGDHKQKESKLSDLSNLFSRLAPELNVGIITIAHANEEGDTKYCKTIAQKAAFEIVLERDQQSDDLEEANTTYIRVGRKNRVGGGSGPAGSMKFDFDTYTLTPKEGFSDRNVFDNTPNGELANDF